MEIKPNSAYISMVPGDKLKLNVGIDYKCDIIVLSDGDLRIYYKGGKSIEL